MDSGPLATLIRGLIAADDELRQLQDQARQRRLRLAGVRLPVSICPAEFTQEALARLVCTDVPTWGSGITNPWAVWLRRKIERRVAEIIAGVFDQLREGVLVGVGLQPPAAAHTRVPSHLWHCRGVSLDMRRGGLLVGATALFLAVEIAQPAARVPLSEAAARRFIERFASHMAACGRTFSSGEATEACGHASNPNSAAGSHPAVWRLPGHPRRQPE